MASAAKVMRDREFRLGLLEFEPGEHDGVASRPACCVLIWSALYSTCVVVIGLSLAVRAIGDCVEKEPENIQFADDHGPLKIEKRQKKTVCPNVPTFPDPTGDSTA